MPPRKVSTAGWLANHGQATGIPLAGGGGPAVENADGRIPPPGPASVRSRVCRLASWNTPPRNRGIIMQLYG